MTKPPDRYRPTDARSIAEAVFKPAPPKPEGAPTATPRATLPGTTEVVSIRLDSDVLAHFQADGPGWQARINAALRKAAAL